MVDVGVALVPPRLSACRIALRAAGWSIYIVAIVTAIGFLMIDPHGTYVGMRWGHIAVAVTTIVVIAAAYGQATRLVRRPRWAHPIAFRAATLAALVAVGAFSSWQARREDLATQRQYLAAYLGHQHQLTADAQRVDESLARLKGGELTPYTDPPCRPTPGLGSVHCWSSSATMDSLAATLAATLSSGDAQQLASQCAAGGDVCSLRGELAAVSVRIFLRRVAAASCGCPVAASSPPTRTLVIVYITPAVVLHLK